MMRLYWVTTEDHCEDWFILACNEIEATKLHENMEGYDNGDALAEWVLDIPGHMGAEEGWPPEELLLELGAKFLQNDAARVVEISGRKFCEGLLESTIRSLDDDMFESLGQGRINDTTKGTDSQH